MFLSSFRHADFTSMAHSALSLKRAFDVILCIIHGAFGKPQLDSHWASVDCTIVWSRFEQLRPLKRGGQVLDSGKFTHDITFTVFCVYLLRAVNVAHVVCSTRAIKEGSTSRERERERETNERDRDKDRQRQTKPD